MLTENTKFQVKKYSIPLERSQKRIYKIFKRV